MKPVIVILIKIAERLRTI